MQIADVGRNSVALVTPLCFLMLSNTSCLGRRQGGSSELSGEVCVIRCLKVWLHYAKTPL
jgi:hypothetical protein